MWGRGKGEREKEDVGEERREKQEGGVSHVSICTAQSRRGKEREEGEGMEGRGEDREEGRKRGHVQYFLWLQRRKIKGRLSELWYK